MRSFIILPAVFLLLSGLLSLSGCASNKPSTDSNKIGIVLMHGKGGTTKWIDSLASDLHSANILVSTPNMPWHSDRIYDKTFNASLLEIKKHVQNLKSQGAKKIYIAGHSLGAIAATGYGAQVGDVNGIILLAPGHFTAWHAFNSTFKSDLAKAELMIANGNGNKTSMFNDINGGTHYTRNVTAKIYKSWFAPDEVAFLFNVAALPTDVAMLYIAGGADRYNETNNKHYAFNKAPHNKHNRYVTLNAKHLEVPSKSTNIILDWVTTQ